MKKAYIYYLSSKKEGKHEITRKEFIRMLGESGHCCEVIEIANGIGMSVAGYAKAERLLKNAQASVARTGCGFLWSCGSYTLYLERAK